MAYSKPRVRKSTRVSAGPVIGLVAIVTLFAAITWRSCASAGSAAASAVDALPQPTQYVVDLAGIIDSSSRTRLLGYLQELEEKTGTQLLILTVKTIGGVPIEQYSLAVAEKWKLGQKGKDNGMLILVAVDDRQYRLEVGRGLEGPLPDAFVGRVGRDYFVPYFRQGKYGEGLFQGTVAVLSRLESEFNVKLTGLPQAVAGAPSGGQGPDTVGGLLRSIFTLVFVGIVILSILKSRLWFLFFTPWGHGGWGGGSSRSGGFGGGFGSFRGGGGGSFSGGGASGRW